MLSGGADPDTPCGPDCALHKPGGENPGHHVFVSTTDGRVPGLLVEWMRRDDGWWARCVYARRGQAGASEWVTEIDWVPTRRVERA